MIKIFDTTLRDGEQSPGASMNTEEKIKIALQLEKLGVDIIEAGFPITSKDDFNAVNQIAKQVRNSTICGLARAVPKDIETCWDAVKNAKYPRIHTFISTSEIHLKYQMKKTKSEVLEMVKNAVCLAKNLCEDVEFSAMDASRTDLDYLCEVFKVAIEEGATTINVPDSVGYAIPNEFGKFITDIIKRIPAFTKDVILSVHCHNDLGLATANSLVAVQNGARQIECAINGLGERGGNAALEEVVMALDVRSDMFSAKTQINKKEIYKTSRLVSNVTGLNVQANKAIVGKNAFAHESGIHQDAILKKRETFEIMSAEDIGLDTNRLVLGKHSGRAALNDRLQQLGHVLNSDELLQVFERFKELCDKKKEVYDEDLEAIVNDEMATNQQKFQLKDLDVHTGTIHQPNAFVQIEAEGKIFESKGDGTGPVDAIYKAIDQVIGDQGSLMEFNVNAVTEGIDAVAEVIVKVKSKEGKTFTGKGVHTDIIVASAKAYLQALNKIVQRR